MRREERIAAVKELHASGASQSAIARQLGVSVATVARDLKSGVQTIVGAAKEKFEDAVQVAKETVREPFVDPVEAAEKAAAQDARANRNELRVGICMAKLRGEDYPRAHRIHEFGPMTGTTVIKQLRATLAAADIDVSETVQVEKVVKNHIEELSREYPKA